MNEEFEQLARATWRHARRLVVFVMGMTLVVIGIALLVLPGPATIVIPAGVAVLATEFVWARRVLKRAKETIVSLHRQFFGTESRGVADREPDEKGH
jgi:uncharacterized protein (TIGR02611 family)